MNVCPACGYVFYPDIPCTAARAVSSVARLYGYRDEHITGTKRGRLLSEARHVAMAAVLAVTGWSLQEVGQMFKRDHSTVVYAVQRVAGNDLLHARASMAVLEAA